jgi:hypothetical protein
MQQQRQGKLGTCSNRSVGQFEILSGFAISSRGSGLWEPQLRCAGSQVTIAVLSCCAVTSVLTLWACWTQSTVVALSTHSGCSTQRCVSMQEPKEAAAYMNQTAAAASQLLNSRAAASLCSPCAQRDLCGVVDSLATRRSSTQPCALQDAAHRCC